MKKQLLSLCLLFAGTAVFAQTKHVITASGLSYVPDSIAVQVGDTIEFNVGATHPTVQVSQSTWNSNGTTPLAGGFDFQSGQGSFVVSQVGVMYYVCQNHVASGMKGRIFAFGINLEEKNLREVSIYPNPAGDELQLSLPYSPDLKLRIINMTGQVVQQLKVSPGNEEQHFDISNLEAGSYLLQISDGKHARDLRFMKK